MAYLDNKTITVDAILTQKGRQLLAKNGSLNITSFALADDEIDYNLYNSTHPLGSAFYDIAIRNTPVLEPFSDETQVMKYKLVTLPSGVTAIPVISIAQTSIITNRLNTSEFIISPSTNPTYNTTLGYTAILGNKNAGTLLVTETNSINSTATDLVKVKSTEVKQESNTPTNTGTISEFRYPFFCTCCSHNDASSML